MSDHIDTEADLTEVEDRDLTRAEILHLYAEFEVLNEAYIMMVLLCVVALFLVVAS